MPHLVVFDFNGTASTFTPEQFSSLLEKINARLGGDTTFLISTMDAVGAAQRLTAHQKVFNGI